MCPDGTIPSGYVIDSWDSWRLVCLSVSVDLFLFGLNVTGFLLIGLGVALVYRKILKVAAEKKASSLLSVEIKEHFRQLGDEMKELQRCGVTVGWTSRGPDQSSIVLQSHANDWISSSVSLLRCFGKLQN